MNRISFSEIASIVRNNSISLIDAEAAVAVMYYYDPYTIGDSTFNSLCYLTLKMLRRVGEWNLDLMAGIICDLYEESENSNGYREEAGFTLNLDDIQNLIIGVDEEKIMAIKDIYYEHLEND